MKSQLHDDFVACFRRLPAEVQELARKYYQIWSENPQRPSLQFKRVNKKEAIYSVRVGIGFRALGLWEGDTINWFWIGTHAEYNQMLG